MHGSSVAGQHGRRWIFFGLACLCLLMMSIDMTIVAVALRSIVEDLDTSLVLAAWAMTGYMLTQTVMLPMIGTLGERFGQMRVFIACVVVFTFGSLLCGLAPNIYVLIFCRVLQALGGAGFMTSATAIVAREFPENRSRMIGLFASIMPMGGIVGPNVGGAIIEHFGWRATFLVNVPIGLIAIPLQPSRRSSLQLAADTDRPATPRCALRADRYHLAGLAGCCAGQYRRHDHPAVLRCDRRRCLAARVREERLPLDT